MGVGRCEKSGLQILLVFCRITLYLWFSKCVFTLRAQHSTRQGYISHTAKLRIKNVFFQILLVVYPLTFTKDQGTLVVSKGTQYFADQFF